MKLIRIIFFLSFTYSCSAQTTLFDDGAQIEVKTDPLYGFIYTHKLEAKQTIYSLAKYFDTSVNDIYQLNLKDKDYIFQINENVKIPFQPHQLISDVQDLKRYNKKIEVLYAVQPKDNLFRISRVLFPQSMDHLIENNDMSDYNLDISEELIVGWLPLSLATTIPNPTASSLVSIASISQLRQHLQFEREELGKLEIKVNANEELALPEEISSAEMSPEEIGDQLTFEKDLTTEEKLVEAIKTKETKKVSTVKLFKKPGIALWDKKISDQDNLFVLHKTAKVNTVLEIYYPLLNKTVQAQVVGNIPKGLYSDEIDLIISPKVAQQLGVRDSRVRVEMKYYD